MFDLLICGGTVIDGSGRAGFIADVAVENGKIAAIGRLSAASARRTISAEGYLVTPGFIDIHRHADAAVFRPGFGELEIHQGLTTIVNGNCGLSAAPIGSAHRREILSYLRPITGEIPASAALGSLHEYFAAQPNAPIHTAMLAGAGTLRADAAGYKLAHMEEGHYRTIHRHLEQALGDGALGISLGLGYAPECFYTTDELIHALSPIAGQNIPLTVHMREEGGGVCRSVEEMLTVAKALHVPLHISHLKAMGRENWGEKIPRALELLYRAHEEGTDVSCDVYPYTAGSTQLLHILPPDFLGGGTDAVVQRLQDSGARRELQARIESGEGFDNIAKLAGWDGIYLTSLHCPEDQAYLGKSLAEIADMTGTSPLDCCCDLLVREHCEITMIDFMASEDDIALILRGELSSVISDATYPTEGMPHPRVYGTFVRLLEHFVREKGILTVEEGIARMTSRPAAALRLFGKGALRPGADADINIFKLERLHEAGSYTDPCRMAQGMETVIVGGQIALEHGQMTAARAGQIIRR